MYKLIIIFIISFFGCNKIDTNDTKKKSISELDNNIIHNPLITINKEGIVSLRASANKLIKDDNKDALLIGNVISDFYDENGVHQSILYSDSAVMTEMNDNFSAFGNVILESDSGFVLTTNKIFWDNNYKKIISKDSVRFTTEDRDTIYGIGFESEMDLSNWIILKPTGVSYRIID